ncbi:unnamed protein product [Rotaria sordida]|uniref:Uncharacterized protein n=1 Tax=Rotaria sordida TaxID=392033 RepID=A0A814SE34_9BILA|nr:unnamed protein product [Rotaria sordida]CAF1500340.1 unnamed protein product [Rotaria sordida]
MKLTDTLDAQEFSAEPIDSTQLNSATVITNKDDLNDSCKSINDLSPTFNRRFLLTSRDIAVASMIYKVSHLQNNKDMDSLCKLFNALSLNLFPKSMKAIQQQLHPDFDLNKFYRICSNCGAYDSNFIHALSNNKFNNYYQFLVFSLD